ncbi:pescadillo [Acrasis kona]|uniref:Pescadillo homolog n=1 Tax=Acrasis kona TaxID=1008807 RepID=A0AAW2ZFW6_9EUKA
MGKAPRKIGANNWGGRKVKKNKYISRNDAMKYLQLTMADFRRLCILKGIYPKQPSAKAMRNKRKLTADKPYKQNSLYYYVKDIKFMAHDPLIVKFREHKTFMKKLKNAISNSNEREKESLLKYVKPKMTYDHLVKERYPTFQAAISDLDDCLTLMFMFSKLPSGYGGIEAKKLALVKRLCDEFCTYVAHTRSLRKVFLSFKGVYYQAQILNQTVTWIIPYDFTQQIPTEVDFKVFKEFLTFYTTLQTFVNYKLFHDLGIKYPVTFAQKEERSYILEIQELNQGDKLTDIFNPTTLKKKTIESQQEQDERVDSLQSKMIHIVASSTNNDDDDDDDALPEEEESNETNQVDAEAAFNERFRNLFQGLTFLINRECPRATIEFCVRSFGGRVIQDDSAQKATHHIIDRPIPLDKRDSTREHVQPQWIFDCINARIRLPIAPYEALTSFDDIRKLPPHLSPFVTYDDTSYEPKYAQEIRKMVESELKVLKNTNDQDVIEEEKAVDQVQDYDSDEDRDEQERRHRRELRAEMSGMSNEEYQKILQKESEDGQLNELKKIYNSAGAGATKKLNAADKKELENKELKLSMMSRRKRKLYEYEMSKISKKDEASRVLMERKIRLDEQAAQNKNQQDDDDDGDDDDDDEPIPGEFEAEAEDQERDDLNLPPANDAEDDDEVEQDDNDDDDGVEMEEEPVKVAAPVKKSKKDNKAVQKKVATNTQKKDASKSKKRSRDEKPQKALTKKSRK